MTYQFDILSCAPESVTLRDVQVKALLWVQENWEKLKVIILNMPVGAGKSIVAMTICEWIKRNGLGKTATITPTKILQDQYVKDFTWVPMLKGMESYACHATPAGNCKATKQALDKCCAKGCPYIATRTVCQLAPVSLYNFHSYRWNKMWKRNVIIDEGHNAAGFLFEMFSLKLWQVECKYDKDVDPTIENVKKIILDALAPLQKELGHLSGQREASLEETVRFSMTLYRAIIPNVLGGTYRTNVETLRDQYAMALAKKMPELSNSIEEELLRYSTVSSIVDGMREEFGEDYKLFDPHDIAHIVEERLEDEIRDRLAPAHTGGKEKKLNKQIDDLDSQIKRYNGVLNCLAKWEDDVLLVKKEEEYHGDKVKSAKNTKQIVICIKPLRVSSFAAEVLWPPSITDKVILMSATISMNDAEELGLTKDVGYFESESPIPKERRPFVVLPVANMGMAAQNKSVPIIADYLLKLAARHPNEKGIIHCTYSVAKALEKILGRNSRFWFHGNMNKVDVYQRFRAEKGNAILVASGMAEGIDLPDDAARWQAITKVQWPSLADDVNQWRARNAPSLYQWDTVRTIIQQSGRICRGPNDYGVTYMLDEAFIVLWNRTKSMWPQWFKEAVVWIKQKGE